MMHTDLYNIDSIKFLLSRHGFKFSKSLGQNFLIDETVPQRIADMSALDSSTGVLEIGPGIGALTAKLCPLCAKVVSVELDPHLPALLRETMAQFDNFTLVPGDILKTDLAALTDEHFQGLRPIVCANLPYNITSPVITKLIDSGLFDSMTLMVQREVARRICAEAGGKDYGALSVFVQYYYEARLLFDVPPDSFIPAPKVTSAVVLLKKRSSPPQKLVSEQFFFRVVRAAFAQRRKILINSLQSAFAGQIDKTALTNIVTELGHSPTIRGEELNIDQFAELAYKILEKM